MKVEIVSVSSLLYSGEANFVVATAQFGEMGIKPRHTPLLAMLKPGNVRIYNGHQDIFYISGGFLEVQPNSVTVLAEEGERADEIDQALAEQARQRALQLLKGAKQSTERVIARSQLAEALAKLEVLHLIHHHKSRK